MTTNHETAAVDAGSIKRLMDGNKTKIKLSLKMCAHCGWCADSCFLYRAHGGNPVYMPSHKVINSLGVLYKRKGKVDRTCLERVKEIVWKRCVLCTRCYCPLGIDIPGLIALTRGICRSQGVVPDFACEQVGSGVDFNA